MTGRGAALSLRVSAARGRGWAGPAASPDPQRDAEEDEAAPQRLHGRSRGLWHGPLSCTESSCRGLAKRDVGTTMPPVPSLPARPPCTGAGGIGRRVVTAALGFG